MTGTTERTVYTEDALRWLKMCFSKFENCPENMERITLANSPLVSMKYKEVAIWGRGFYIHAYAALVLQIMI